MTTYTLNNAFNGIEITFGGKPAENIREQLKAAGFRWHNKNKLWYARQSAERLALAEALASGTAPKAEAVKAEPVRDHSLKVGDILASSWGYEQTNNNFYRVEALKGRTMVQVREVYLKIAEETPTCSMASDRKYAIPSEGDEIRYANNEILTRKVKNWYADNRPEGDCIDIESFETAYKYNGETMYCSWYY